VTTPVVQLRDLSFSWPRAPAPVLRIEALDIAPGEMLFIEGPSGSGKTTLLSLLGAVLTPGKGTLKLMANDLAGLSNAARDRLRADHIGFIFQMFNLIPYLSTIDNVLLPCHFSVRRREQARRTTRGLAAEAGRLIRRLGLDEAVAGRPVTALSVGQQQRVAAARALIGAPELVVADEPTSALDADARADFLALLFEQCERARSTLVFVSHDRSLAASFDRRVSLPDINHA